MGAGAVTVNRGDIMKKNESKVERAFPGPPIALQQERGYSAGAWEFSRQPDGQAIALEVARAATPCMEKRHFYGF